MLPLPDLVQEIAEVIARSHRDADLRQVPWGNLSLKTRQLLTDQQRVAARGLLASRLVLAASDVIEIAAEIEDATLGHTDHFVAGERAIAHRLRDLTQRSKLIDS